MTTTMPTSKSVPAFDRAIDCVQFLTPDEKLGLMKILSLSLGGPRLYTETDVKVIVQGALDEHRRRGRALNVAVMGKRA